MQGSTLNRLFYINGWKFFTNFSRSTRYQALKIHPMAMFSLPKRSNGLHLVFGAHIIQKYCIQRLTFCTYLEIGDNPTDETWSHGRVWSCEHFQQFGSWFTLLEIIKENRKTLLLMDKSNIEHNASMADIVLQLSRDPLRIKPWKWTI